MNRDDVQAALHASVIPIPSNKWVPCNDDLRYRWAEAPPSTLPIIKKLLRVWVFSDQVGGFTVLYDGLTFVTIRGAGHMVPMITPVLASQLLASNVPAGCYY
ncbi:hypothetical protein PR202_ga14286 [Eleusine coracana subsp. coracana]|uniref:Uncharacterized protein n=1 Tax=Eleusine coracana subsp. coracana TaxID=191504 RepID=A0AAV5CGS5_ELECO|nr:hypothetical protein PR202_ga14286 [Eleusine coracana subsp. coracana]